MLHSKVLIYNAKLIAYCNLASVFNSTAAINHSLVLKAAYSCTFYSLSALDFFFFFVAESVVLGMCVCICVCIYVTMSALPDNTIIYVAACALQGVNCVCDLLIAVFCCYLCLHFI